MKLNSKKVGSQVLDILKSNSAGKIQSVHRNSFYSHFNQQILLIHEDNYGLIPFGIAIKGLDQYLSYHSLKTNMVVWSDGAYLRIPEGNLEISLLDGVAKADKNTGKSAPSLVTLTMIQANIDYAGKYLLENGSKEGLGGLAAVMDSLFSGLSRNEAELLNMLGKYCYQQLGNLLNGTIENNEQKMNDSLKKLIGLGLGLTPSMDDILVGYISTLNYLQQQSYCNIKGLSPLSKIVTSMSSRKTSRISSAYLNSAASGECYSIIDDVVYHALHQTTPDNEYRRCLNRLLNVGSNSGTEMLLGVVLAFKVSFRIRREEVIKERCNSKC